MPGAGAARRAPRRRERAGGEPRAQARLVEVAAREEREHERPRHERGVSAVRARPRTCPAVGRDGRRRRAGGAGSLVRVRLSRISGRSTR